LADDARPSGRNTPDSDTASIDTRAQDAGRRIRESVSVHARSRTLRSRNSRRRGKPHDAVLGTNTRYTPTERADRTHTLQAALVSCRANDLCHCYRRIRCAEDDVTIDAGRHARLGEFRDETSDKGRAGGQ